MTVFSFNRFVNEKFGLSEASIIFEPFLAERMHSLFKKFLLSGKDSYASNTIINYSELLPFIKNVDLYSKFPIVGIDLKFSFDRIEFDIDTENVQVGGECFYFGNRNWSDHSKLVDIEEKSGKRGIILVLGIYVDISKTFDINNNNDYTILNDCIRSSIYHELNHGFEIYRRLISKNNKIIRPNLKSPSTTLTGTAINTHNFPGKIWKLWDLFGNYLYHTESHEINADVQEMSYFIRKYPDRDIDSFDIYDRSIDMTNFNADYFYKLFIDEISKHIPYIGIEKDIAEQIKNLWVDIYKEKCFNDNKKPFLSFDRLAKMSCLEFLRFWQIRINISGHKILRKIDKMKFAK